MRISDWSSDVCSSDLAPLVLRHKGAKDQAAAVMAWPTAGGFAGARESRQLEILTQIFNDRLFEGLRSQDGAAYSPSVEHNWPFSFDNCGYISVTSQLKHAKRSTFLPVSNRDRRSAASGKRVSVRVDLDGRSIIKKNT